MVNSICVKLMYRFYKYIFYRIYTWNIKQWGGYDLPANAIFPITAMLYLDILIIILLLKPFVDESRFLEYLRDKDYAIGLAVAIFVTNYFLLVFNKKYERILKEFKNETLKQRKKGTIIVAMYIVLTMILLPISFLVAFVF